VGGLLLRREQLLGVGVLPLVEFDAGLLNVLLDPLHRIHAAGENRQVIMHEIISR